MEAISFLKSKTKLIQVDGRPAPTEVTNELKSQIKL